MPADPIAEFYSRHPYPPPVENLDRAGDEWRADPNRGRAEHHLFWPDTPYRGNLNILVAGCGTWQAAKYALTHPDARVTGIDVSPTSIEHTAALKKKYSLTNLELRQLAIEAVGDLTGNFDLIVCTGVLHHLADPDAGLRALRAALEPDGAMYLMVYAPYGRAGVYMIQDYCRRLGVGASAREIEDLTATLAALTKDHPLVRLLQGSRDATDPDALADALLNPRDRAFSVPQLYELLERNGLAFDRWYWQAPYLPQCGAFAATPHASRLAALPDREQHAAMELLRGMMTTHSVIARRSDASRSDGPFGAADDRWLGLAPLRLPWTVLVEESLPPGAAGALINRSHPFRDLVVILTPNERRLFDRIDGNRRIGDILADAREVPHADARAFFEKLWRYDQIA
jgi:2-polyprenyl-3-methyl-5-hydroxy-6-metoxy-1,4-benzoquinol methylase